MFPTFFTFNLYMIKETNNTFCTSIQFYCISISLIVVTVLLLSSVYVFLLSIMFLYCISLYMCSILCTTNYHSLNWYSEKLNTTNCFRLIIVKCFTIYVAIFFLKPNRIHHCLFPKQTESKIVHTFTRKLSHAYTLKKGFLLNFLSSSLLQRTILGFVERKSFRSFYTKRF